MNTQTQKAQQVPLIQLLRRVPENAKLIVDNADGMGSTFHPVGRLCHEAAEALAQLAQNSKGFINPEGYKYDYDTGRKK